MELSTEEKAAVSRLLYEKDGIKASVMALSPYLLPTIILAAYGIYHQDYVACALGYGCLLMLSIWYLQSSSGYVKDLKSAISKYEAATNRLGTNSGQQS
ncbi:MAG: hypothetical protein ACK5HY_04160 [Parahaliea sp.]